MANAAERRHKNRLVFSFVRRLAGFLPSWRNARLAAVVLALIWPVAAAAFPLLKLPAFDGEMSGDFESPGTGLALHWRISAESPPEEPGVRRGRLEIEGQGVRIVARATLGLANGVTRWEIEKTSADLAVVFPNIASHLLPEFAHLSVSGTMSAEGHGTLTSSGDFNGAATLVISDAEVSDFFGGWSAKGLDARVEFPALPALRTAPAQRISLRAFSHPDVGVELGDITTEAALGDDMRIRFSNTKLAAYGGAVTLEPFTLDPAAPSVATSVHVEGVDSRSLAGFLPGSVAEANGRFSGGLALAWSPGTGVVPGVGKLSLIKAPGTSIRLTSAPGLFTSGMDQRLYFLPESAGFLRRVFSLKNPAYATLKKIEEGSMPINVENITISFTPDGDEQGRSASVVIAARPADGKSAVKRLRINVNVTGPLSKVLEMSTTDRVQIGF